MFPPEYGKGFANLAIFLRGEPILRFDVESKPKELGSEARNED